MECGQFAVAYRQLGRLLRNGGVAGLSEGQLLDRFVANRDDTAFEAILSRHGPMVLGVCRSMLRDSNDIDDAFQATFLVLVKKADTLRDRDLLGNWLYGVAHRVAKRARIEAAKRHDRRPTGPEPATAPVDDFDLRPEIHNEVNRLPKTYREAIILCYLEGRTHEEAARELGWPVGTVRGRLARARDLLRSRLIKHGFALSTGAIVTTLTKQAEALVPPALIETTCKASILLISGRITTTLLISTRVLSLTQGVLTTMSATRMKLGVTLLVAMALTGPGVSAFQGPGTGPPTPVPDNPQEKKIPDTKSVEKESQKAPIKPSDRVGEASTTIKASADSRIQLAQEAIAILEKSQKAGETAAHSPELIRWQRRLIEAQNEEGGDPAIAVDKYVKMTKALETGINKLFESAQVSRMELLNAKFGRIEAEKFANEILNKKVPTNPMPTNNGLAPGIVPHGDTMGVDPPEPPRLRKLPKENPADADRNKVIEKILDEKISMPFSNAGTPLEDIIKYIRTSTVNEKLGFPSGIPIYVDPFVLIDNSDDPPKPKMLKTIAPIDLEGIPLRVTLRLILDQFMLAYQVRDQMIYIMDEELLDMRYNGGFIEPPSNPNTMKGTGGMGGINGGAAKGGRKLSEAAKAITHQ